MKYRYRHTLHCPEWQNIDWPHGGEDAADDIAANLAEDWADDETDEIEISMIMDDIEVELLENEA